MSKTRPERASGRLHVAYVGAPILVAPLGGEGDLLRGGFSTATRLFEAVDPPVLGHDPPAGRAPQVYAHLPQSRVDAGQVGSSILSAATPSLGATYKDSLNTLCAVLRRCV